LTSLYAKTVPVVKTCHDQIQEIGKEHLQVKQIVQSYDQSIACKANKPEINKLEIQMRDFAKEKDFLEFKEKVGHEISVQAGIAEQVVSKVDKIANELSNEILLAVRRATAHLKRKDESA
jgi:hypothetical protein